MIGEARQFMDGLETLYANDAEAKAELIQQYLAELKAAQRGGTPGPIVQDQLEAFANDPDGAAKVMLSLMDPVQRATWNPPNGPGEAVLIASLRAIAQAGIVLGSPIANQIQQQYGDFPLGVLRGVRCPSCTSQFVRYYTRSERRNGWARAIGLSLGSCGHIVPFVGGKGRTFVCGNCSYYW